jgi:hypothetical protein
MEVIDVFLAVMHGRTPRSKRREGDLPDACCKRRLTEVKAALVG